MGIRVSNPQHESVALDGYWRLLSFGKLGMDPLSASKGLWIWSTMAPLTDQNVQDCPTGEVKRELVRDVPIPIGELPRFYPNVLIHDGRLASGSKRHFSFERPISRAINCDRSNLTFFYRGDTDDSGEPIIPVRNGWEDAGAKEWRKNLFVAFGSDTDRYSVLAPTVEVFRFFYATSDVLSNVFLSDRILNPHMHIWNTKRTGLLEDGSAILWLRKRMLDSDARYIARFAFDKYALTQAQEIFLHAAAIGRSGENRIIRATPPFVGISNLEFLAIPVTSRAGHERMLVTRFLSCDWAPPWTELRWDRDNDGRFDPKNREEREEMKLHALLSPPDPDEAPDALSSNAPSRPTVPFRIREEEICERFPELHKSRAEKMPQENTTARADKPEWRHLAKEAFPGSVIEGSSSEELVGRAIIEGLDHAQQIPKKHTTDVDGLVGRQERMIVVDLLKRIHDEGWAVVQFLVVTPYAALLDDLEVNVFPEEVDGKQPAWLFMDVDKTMLRTAVLAKIDRGGRSRYILELQQKRHGECATLVIWDRDERKVAPGLLSLLILQCAELGGAKLRVDYLGGVVQWGKLKHCELESNSALAKRYLEKIFLAKCSGKAPQRRTL